MSVCVCVDMNDDQSGVVNHLALIESFPNDRDTRYLLHIFSLQRATALYVVSSTKHRECVFLLILQDGRWAPSWDSGSFTFNSDWIFGTPLHNLFLLFLYLGRIWDRFPQGVFSVLISNAFQFSVLAGKVWSGMARAWVERDWWLECLKSRLWGYSSLFKDIGLLDIGRPFFYLFSFSKVHSIKRAEAQMEDLAESQLG